MNETQRKALLLLGLARKARKLEIGEEPCGIACRSGKAKLLLIAHDAGDHTFRRARSYCRAGKPPYLCVPFTKDELGTHWAATPARCAQFWMRRLQRRFWRTCRSWRSSMRRFYRS
ncbi:MAG: hypothetical protein V8S92_09280 [Oscillospiraceae bacterium]